MGSGVIDQGGLVKFRPRAGGGRSLKFAKVAKNLEMARNGVFGVGETPQGMRQSFQEEGESFISANISYYGLRK